MGQGLRCLDTYALIEIDKRNPRFAQYTKANFVVTGETLAEFFWVLMREANQEIADSWHKKLLPFSVSVSPTLLVKAMLFRREHRKQRISFFDAVGYVYSRANNIPFVTGDKEFKHFRGVEFQGK